jgi:hypothetical protein
MMMPNHLQDFWSQALAVKWVLSLCHTFGTQRFLAPQARPTLRSSTSQI